ncbi:hypothetical protein [Flavobacterium sp. 1355]|uniref:hypothetical protein n=1 Tax=Flavobacterium sp. 1355 TaxID=2806571 RepID=UPI001AE39639|nr:hypothetical protein [Flavobacterium sp. 1355]MBP1224655.1 hypothetical protein [Flavobacterium sp. 1355]
MKKTILYATISAMFLIFSCQKDNSQEDSVSVSAIQKENWLTADLDSKFANSQKQVTAYLFDNDEMSKLVKTPNINEVRFVLGYSDNTIQIDVVGVDKSGKKLGTVSSTILKDSNYSKKLDELNDVSVSTTNKRTALLNAHLLSPKDAFKGIEAWQKKLSSVSDLDEITSHEGSRFRYFSLESDIVKAMVDKSGTANIGLFLGLNPVGKVTTILISLDKSNTIKKTSLASKTATSDVYDATRPCPPNGDPETDE